MRPLTAALALLAATQGGRFELRGVARMHERPIGDLVDALRQLGCRIDYLGQPRLPAAAARAGSAADRRAAADPRPRRRLEPVPDRAAARAAADQRRCAAGDRGRRRADLAAVRRHHARPAGALRHRRRTRRLAALHDRAAQPLPFTGRIHVEGDASSASYFIALGRSPPTPRRCASKASAAIRSRATSASSTRPRRWGRRSAAARAGSRRDAAASRCRRCSWTATTSPTRR